MREEAFEVIRSGIGEAPTRPEDGDPRVELRGERAGILVLAANSRNKKPGNLSAAGFPAQIKLVKGIGFEPMTFRL